MAKLKIKTTKIFKRRSAMQAWFSQKSIEKKSDNSMERNQRIKHGNN